MRSVRRASLPLAVLVTLPALALAGCGSSSTSQTSTATTGSGQEARPPKATSSNAGAPAGSKVTMCDSALPSAGLRVAGASCTTARGTLLAWKRDERCSSPSGASRYACTVNGFRCLGLNAERGIAVSCANGSQEIAFIAKG